MREIAETSAMSTRPGEDTPRLIKSYEMREALISSKGETYLRRSWSIKDDHNLLVIRFGAVIEAKVSTKPLWTASSNEFNWYRVEYNGEVYYVANAGNLVLEFIEVDEPDKPTNSPDATQPTLSAELIELVDALVEQRLQERVAGLEKLVAIDIPLPHATYHTTAGSLTTTISTLELFRNVLTAMIAGLKNSQPSLVITDDKPDDVVDDDTPEVEIPDDAVTIPQRPSGFTGGWG